LAATPWAKARGGSSLLIRIGPIYLGLSGSGSTGLKSLAAHSDQFSVEICRVCGAECAARDLLPVHRGGGCRSCNGSPSCTRCGHPRRQHRGAFGGGANGCKVRVSLEVGLAVGRCGCAGYTADAAAFVESVPLVDVNELRLRQPGDPAPRAAPALTPVRDLFEEGRRLADLTEDDRLPWRPSD
jgi:hypothetical protein